MWLFEDGFTADLPHASSAIHCSWGWALEGVFLRPTAFLFQHPQGPFAPQPCTAARKAGPRPPGLVSLHKWQKGLWAASWPCTQGQRPDRPSASSRVAESREAEQEGDKGRAGDEAGKVSGQNMPGHTKLHGTGSLD